MNIHYLINSQGQTEGVVVPLALWQQMLAILEKSLHVHELIHPQTSFDSVVSTPF